MKTWISIFSGLFLFAQPLAAEELSFESSERQVGLLELYTSEGCSSCPPADRWLSALKDQPGLWQSFIPIALHVDYWDYIGWEDPFATPEHSSRQRQYAREQSLKAVYTPGFVYNGSEWRKWYSSKAVDFPAGDTPGVMRLQLEGQTAKVQFLPASKANGKLQLTVALLGFGIETSVKAGENRGKKLPHDFVVLGMNSSTIKFEDGQYAAQLQLPQASVQPRSYGVVAWLNKPGAQRPIQAVGGMLPENLLSLR